MEIRRRTASSVFWTTFQGLFDKLISLAVFLLLARLLAPEHFGIVSLAGAITTFAELFLKVGFAEVVVQRDELDDGHLDTAFWTMACIGTALTLGMMLLSSPVAIMFESPEIAPVLRWLALGLFMVSISRVQAAILRRNFRFRKLALRTLIATVASGVVGITMALAGMGVWALVASRLVDYAVGLALLWLSSPWRPGFRVSIAHFRDLFSYGANVMGVQFMHFSGQQGTRLIIGYFLNTVALGYFAIANRIVQIVQMLVAKTFMTVLFSSFSRMQGDIERLGSAFLTTTRLLGLLILPVFVYLMVAAPTIVSVLLGDKWNESIVILQYLSISGLLQSMTVLHESVFRSVGRPQLSLRVSTLQAVVVAAAILASVSYGIHAVALGIAVGQALVTPYSFYLLKQVLPFGPLKIIQQSSTTIIAVVAMYLIIIFIQESATHAAVEGLPLLVLLTIIGAAVYCMTIWFIDRALARDALAAIGLVVSRGKSNNIRRR